MLRKWKRAKITILMYIIRYNNTKINKNKNMPTLN